MLTNPDRPPNILIVSTNRMNCQMLGKFLESQNYRTTSVCSLDEVEATLKGDTNDISLALIDLSGFDSDIWQECEKMRQNNLPFIVFSPFPNPAISLESMKSGAKAVMIKPLIMKELLFNIQNFLKGTT